MFNELMVVGGTFWSLTYVLIIIRGFKDKTFGMPFVALSANISWEAMFSFVRPHLPPQLYIDYAWFLLDLVIVFQFFRYGRSEFPKISALKSRLLFLASVSASFAAIYFTCYKLGDWNGAYAAFGQNLLMSVLFIRMFYRREEVRGQSFLIALFKMLGTGISSVAFYLYQPVSHQSIVLPLLYISIFVCDIIYLAVVYQKSREAGLPLLKIR